MSKAHRDVAKYNTGQASMGWGLTSACQYYYNVFLSLSDS